MVLVDSVCGDSQIPQRQRLPAVFSHGRGQGGSLGSLIRALIPVTRVPLSWPNPLPKASLPNTITWGDEDSTYEFGGDVNIQTVTHPLLYPNNIRAM